MNYLANILFFFGALGVFNSILVSIYFLLGRPNSKLTNTLFGAFLLALNFRVLKSVFYSFSTHEPILFLQSGPSYFLLIGPLLYLYTQKATSTPVMTKLDKFHLWLWFFVILALMFIFPFPLHRAFNKDVLLPLINLQWLGYIIGSGIILWNSTKSINNISLTQQWLTSLLASVFALWLVYFFIQFDYFISGSILFSFIFYGVHTFSSIPKWHLSYFIKSKQPSIHPLLTFKSLP